MTPSDNPSSQTNVQLLQPEKKRRKINDRSTTSPVPEQEREKINITVIHLGDVTVDVMT